MRRSLAIVMLLAVVPMFVSCFGLKLADFPMGGRVALVEIKGVIMEPDDVVEDLEKARKKEDIKAVLVRVDSPGGSVGASQEIFRTIRELDKTKPVIVSMGDVAASGGYYVSAGARKIFANEGTVTGSIGVRMEHVNAGRLYELLRLQPETLKSGEYKDIGSTFRALTPEERKILEDFLTELHGQFKADVGKGRGLDIDFVNKIADGRIYSGQKAKEMGLVDQMGGLMDALKEAASIAKIKGEPRLVKMRKKKPWWYDFVSERLQAVVGTVGGQWSGFKYFLYEWRP